MKKQKKEPEFEGLVKLYREFSRQNYNRYQLKYPRMKESEIISRVQKEWDILDEHSKLELQKLYQEKNYLDDEELGEMSPLDAPTKVEHPIIKQSEKSKTPSKMKVLEVEAEPRIDDSEISSVKEKKILIDTDSDKDQLNQLKKKAIKVKTDLKNKEYLSFYKYYYDRLSSQHPKWKSHQISTIIKLLWRKRLITKKRDTQIRKNKVKAGKGILRARKIKKTSGYLTFKKKYITKHGPGTTTKIVKTIFKRLTFQQKHLLNRQAKLYNNQFFPVKAKARQEPSAQIAILLDTPSETYKPLSFLNNIMK